MEASGAPRCCQGRCTDLSYFVIALQSEEPLDPLTLRFGGARTISRAHCCGAPHASRSASAARPRTFVPLLLLGGLGLRVPPRSRLSLCSCPAGDPSHIIVLTLATMDSRHAQPCQQSRRTEPSRLSSYGRVRVPRGAPPQQGAG